jgi:hypothetical protein
MVHLKNRFSRVSPNKGEREMATIPEGILLQISEHRPDLAWMCKKVHCALRPATVCEYERLLATFYLRGVSQLTQEEKTGLIGCVAGQGYEARGEA